MFQQLSFKRTTGLDVEAPIDGLVRHLIVLVDRIHVLKPTRNLLWRPLQSKLARHHLGECPIPDELTCLWAPCALPGELVSLVRQIALSATISADLAADSRRSTP
ncbi:hypothetical protein AWV80_38290 [Cupriavidus sp. UYMU48A]|nr:hypothetical protein AWV80_38290 [Cupriavidus sp. UYMU48A]